MRTLNRAMFRERIHIKRTRGNRVFEFIPTDSVTVNRQFPQLYISYQRLLPIHSIHDLDDVSFKLMADLVEKNFANLKPSTIQAIDIIDTYCNDDFTTIYLYDEEQDYLGKIITCAPDHMIHQVINSRCNKAEYWSLDGNEEFGKTLPPRTTRHLIKNSN